MTNIFKIPILLFLFLILLLPRIFGQNPDPAENQTLKEGVQYALYHQDWMCGYFNHSANLSTPDKEDPFQSIFKSDIPGSNQVATILLTGHSQPDRGLLNGVVRFSRGDPFKGFSQAVIDFSFENNEKNDPKNQKYDSPVTLKSGNKTRTEIVPGNIKVVGHFELSIPFLEKAFADKTKQIDIGVVPLLEGEKPTTLTLFYHPSLEYELPLGKYKGPGFASKNRSSLVIFGESGHCNFFKGDNGTIGLRVKDIKKAPRYFRDMSQLQKRTPESVLYDFYDAISTANEPLLDQTLAVDDVANALGTNPQNLKRLLFSGFLTRLTGLTASRIHKMIKNQKLVENQRGALFSFDLPSPENQEKNIPFSLNFSRGDLGYRLISIIGLLKSPPIDPIGPPELEEPKLDPNKFLFCHNYLDLTLLVPEDPQWEILLRNLLSSSEFTEIRTVLALNFAENLLSIKNYQKFQSFILGPEIEFLDLSPLSKLAMMSLWLNDKKSIARLKKLIKTKSQLEKDPAKGGWLDYFEGMEYFLERKYDAAAEQFTHCLKKNYDLGYTLGMIFVCKLRKNKNLFSALDLKIILDNKKEVGKFRYPTIPLLQAIESQWDAGKVNEFLNHKEAHPSLVKYFILEYMRVLKMKEEGEKIMTEIEVALPPLSYEAMALKDLKKIGF